MVGVADVTTGVGVGTVRKMDTGLESTESRDVFTTQAGDWAGVGRGLSLGRRGTAVGDGSSFTAT